MAVLYITKIFPRRQQFSKYHPRKQKLQRGKQSQRRANWVDRGYLSRNLEFPLRAPAHTVCRDPVQATSWKFLICKVGIIICVTRKTSASEHWGDWRRESMGPCPAQCLARSSVPFPSPFFRHRQVQVTLTPLASLCFHIGLLWACREKRFTGFPPT